MSLSIAAEAQDYNVDIAVTSTPDPVLSGEQVVFTIHYANNGSGGSCPNPTMVMELSDLTTYIDASAGGEHDGSAKGGFVEWDLPTIPPPNEPSSVAVTVDVDPGLPDNSTLILEVTLAGKNGSDCGYLNYQPPVNPTPVLQIDKTASRLIAQPGEQISYTIDLENTGNLQADNTSIVDTLPPDTDFLSVSNNGVYDGAAHTVTWNLGILLTGASTSQVIVVKVKDSAPAGANLVNSATATADNADPATDTATTEIASKPLLVIDKTAQDTVQAGGELNYTINYSNDGDIAATGVLITDYFSELVTDIPSASGNPVIDFQTRTIIWDIGTLDAGTSGSFTYVATIESNLLPFSTNNTGVVVNSAELSAVNADKATDDHSAYVIIPTPLLGLEKTGPEVANAGELVNYTITYDNSGAAPSLNTVVEDLLPVQCLNPVISSGGVFDPNTNTIRWDLGVLPIGETGVLTIECRLESPLNDGTQITNTASVFSLNGSPKTSQVVTIVNSSPVLSLTKVGTPNPVKPGDLLYYTLVMKNTGNANATGVSIEDYLDANTRYVSDNAGGTYTSHQVRWDIGQLNAGSEVSIELVTEVDPALTGSVSLSNNAVLTSDQTNPVSVTETVAVSTSPVLFLEKFAVSDVVRPGEDISYLLVFDNIGNAKATNLVLTDAIPNNTQYVSSSGGGVFEDGVVTWTASELAIDDPGYLTLTVRVDSPLDNNTAIVNVATLTSAETQPVNAEKTVLVNSRPILTLEKTSNRNSVEAGEQITYSLDYSNIGNANSTNVVLEDQIPVGTTFVSATGGGTLANGVVTWTDPGLDVGAVGTVHLTVLVDDTVVDDQVIRNTAAISSDQTTPVSATVDVIVEHNPLIELSKTTNVEFVQSGETITYVIEYKNTGNAFATNVVINDELPNHTSFVSATGNGTLLDGVVTWTEGELAIGAVGQVTLTVMVDEGVATDTIIHNIVSANSDQTDPVSSVLDLPVINKPKLTLSKTSPAEFVEAGKQVTFSLSYENVGNATASNVILEDPIPANMIFVSATGGGVLADNTVTWTDPGLEAGATGQVQLTLQVDPAAEDNLVITNTASMVSDETSPVIASDTITVKRTPVLELQKTANSDVVSPGDLITYTLSYQNTGNATAVEVVLEDQVPENTSFISATGGGTLTDGVVTWTFAELAVGGQGSVSMTVEVSPGALRNTSVDNGDIIYNSATLDSANAYAATAEHTAIVQLVPVLELEKTSASEFVEAGESVTFTLSYANTGNATATNVILKDTIPDGTSFVSATGGGVLNDGVVTWTDPGLEIGATGQVQLTVEIDADAALGTIITNIADMDSDNTSPVIASDFVIVKRTPVLTLTKTASLEYVAPGERITYTLAYSNIGNATAYDLILEDPIPEDTTYISSSGGGELVDGIVVWREAELPVGGQGSVTLTVEVDADVIIDDVTNLEDGTIIRNSATLDAVNSYAVSAEDSVVVKFIPDLTLAKVANTEFVEVGDTVVFTLQFSNVGSADAVNVELEDRIPASTTFVSASGGGQLVGDNVVWLYPLLEVDAAGEVHLTLQVDDGTPDGTVINNTAGIIAVDATPETASASVTVKRTPVLDLTKTANVEVVGPGELITYSLAFTNIGNATATNLLLEDFIPANTTFESATGNYTLADGKLTWTYATLEVGEVTEVTMTVRVDPESIADDINTLEDGTIIRNTATLDGDNSYAVSAQADVLVKFTPRLSIEKLADRQVATPGEPIIYSLNVSNSGNGNANNGVLQDTLPANTTFVSASNGGVEADGVVTWSLPIILAGTTQAITLEVLVDTPLDNGTPIYNVATLTSDETTPDSAEHLLSVRSEAVLALEKTADKSMVLAGETITYTLSYANNGNANADNAALTDLLPPDTQFVSASDGGTFDGTFINWPLGTIQAGAGGAVTLVVSVNSPLIDGTIIGNVAALEADQALPAIDFATTVVQAKPELNLSKSADKALVEAGDTLVYTLDFSNTGNANATGVTLTDYLPDNTSFVSATGGGTESGGVVTWPLGTLNAGPALSVSLTVAVDSPLVNGLLLYNVASLDSVENEPVQAVNNVVVQSAPEITLEKTANVALAQPGDTVTYTLTYGNSGNANASNTILTDAVPANTTFVSASGGGTLSNGVVTWTSPLLLAGTTSAVTMTVQIIDPLPNGTVINNEASLVTDQTPAVTSSVDIGIESAPLLVLEKSASTGVVQPGDLLTYTMDIVNSGNANATNVILTDNVPANTTFVSASGGGTEAGGVVTWTTEQLLVNVPASVTMTVEINTPLPDGTDIYNSASLSSDLGGTVTDDVTVSVSSTPVLSLVKTANPTVIGPGDQLTYTLHVENTGNANATNVILTDRVPDWTTFVSATGGGTESGGVVTWTAAELPVGMPGSVTMTVRIDTPLENGTSIVNHASLDSDQTEPVEVSHTMNIQSAPVLTLIKRADREVVNAGEEVTYTLAMLNSGNANASNILLEDTLPANTSFVSASNGGTFVNGVVTWQAPELPVGLPAEVTLTVRVIEPLDDGTTIYNSANLNCDEIPSVTADHTLSVQSEPVLTLQKTADKTVANPGDLITYTLTMDNSGNANANNLVLEDTLPNYTTFVSASSGGTEAGGVVTWTMSELLVGVPASVTLTVEVVTPLDNGTKIFNSATLNSDETAPVSTNHEMSVQSAPVLSLVKSADKTVVNPGDQITYTLTLANNGNANASSILLEDTLPDYVSYVSSSPEGTLTGGVVSWTTAELLAGVGGAVTLTVLVDTPLDNGTTLYNTATLDSAETEPVSTSHTLNVQSSPILSLVKTADKTVVNPGDQITYTLTLGNSGNANASDILLEDTLPNNTSYVSSSPAGTPTGNVISWTTGDLLAGVEGAVTLTVLVDTPLDNGTPINNSATLDSAETEPVSASHSLAVQSAPVLTLVKTADKTVVNPGDEITYTLTLGNTGNANANNIVLDDTIPANTTFVAASGGGTETGGVVTWTSAELLAGAEGSVTLTVLVDTPLDNGTSISNSATLESDETSPVSASHELTVQSAPVLTLVKSADKTVASPGDNITYTLSFSNSGNANASTVVLSDTLPANTTFVSAPGAAESGGIVTWNLGGMDAGSSGSVVLTVQTDSPLDNGISIDNSASLSSDQTAPVTASHTLTIQSAPVLSITKTADKTNVNPGDQITYSLEIANNGNANANNVVLQDTLPANSSFVSASGSGTESGGIVTWNTPSLLAGIPQTMTVTVVVDSPLDNGTLIYNSATLQSDEAGPVSADHSLYVQSAPVLGITKSVDKAVVSPGEQLSYTINYSNSGDANATTTMLVDPLPANTSFVSASDGGSPSNGVVTWSLGTLVAGTSGSVTMVVAVDTPLDNNTVIANTVSLESDQTVPVSAGASSTVQSAPQLTLSKTANQSTVEAGEQLVYTLEYANGGNANATGVVLLDLLPANTSFVSASDGGTESGGLVTWPIGSIGAGTSGNVTLTVAVASPLDNATLLTNAAVLNSAEATPVADSMQVTVQSAPVITLVKTASASLAQPGDTITYTLSFGNNGNANASNPVLTDAIPTNTSFVSATGGGTHADGVVTWTGSSLLAGGSSSVTMTVLIDTPLDNGTVISNLASLVTDQTEAVESSVDITIESAPVLVLDKTASASVINPGELLTYTLNIANEGNANATNVVLTDVVPVNTSFVSATGGGIESAGVVSWSAPELPVGIPASVTMTVMVDLPLSNGTVISNSASLTSDETGEVTDSVDVTVDSAPVLSLAKSADKTVVSPGGTITYTLSLDNSGNANATNVVLADTLPAYTSFVSASGGGIELDGVVTWTATELPVGVQASVTLTVLVDTPLDNGTGIVNNATLESAETEPVSASHSLNVQSTPVLSLVKSADKTVAIPGDQITYTLALENSGNANADTVVLEDAIPANTTFVSASGGGTEAGGVVTWTAAELPVGVPASVTLTVLVDTPLDNGTTIYNTATLDSAQTEPVNAEHSLAVQSSPVLGLVKTADATVANPGDQITYTLTFDNTGNANASDIVLEDTIPLNTSFVSASAGGIESGGVVTWTAPELLVGVSGSVTLTVQVASPLDNGTPIYNSATLSSAETAPVSADHSLAVQSAPVLTLTKTADKTVVNPGDQITYTLSLENIGNENADTVVLEDTIPANTSFVSASGGGTEAGGVVTWTAAELPVGVPASVTLTVLVDTPLDNGTSIYNSATLESAQTSPISADHSLAVQSSPILILVKTADKTVVNPGDQITYTLALENTGNANADTVVLEDTMPANTSFVSASSGGTEAGGVVTWSVPELPVGVPAAVTLTVLVDSPLDNGTPIYNSATLESAQTSPVSADHSLAVQSAPVLTLVKTADKTVVNPGDQITYTLAVENNGNANASTVILEDTIPAHTTFVSASGNSSEVDGVVTWSVAELPVGVPASVALTVLVDTPLDNGTPIYNSATLMSEQTSPVSAEHSLAVQSAPVLSITKTTARTVVEAGENLTYTIEFANTGNANASSVSIEDAIPANTTFVYASGGGVESNGLVSWELGLLEAGIDGSVTLTVRVDTPLDNGTTIYNSVSIKSDQTAPVSADHSIAVQSSAVLTLEKLANTDVVKPGEQIAYTIKFGNIGNANANSVSLVDVLPPDTTFYFASGGGAETDGVVTWPPFPLPVGTEGSVLLIVNVNSPLDDAVVLHNAVAIDASESANPVSAFADVVVQSAPEPRVSKSADVDYVQKGELINYTIGYANTGTTALQDTLLADVLPARTTFVSASNGGVFDDNTVSWDLGSLPVEQGGTVGLTVRANDDVLDGDIISNVAFLSGSNSATVSAVSSLPVVGAASLGVTKSSDIDFVRPGEQVVYTIAYSNSGNAVAEAVTLEDELPEFTSFVSASGGGTILDGLVTWDLGDLAPGEQSSVEMVVMVDEGTENGTVIGNTATLDSDNTPPVSDSKAVTVFVPFDILPLLRIELVPDSNVIAEREEVSYVVSYRNLTAADALDSRIIAVLPANVEFVSASHGGSLETDGRVSWILWDLGTLAGGGDGTVSYTVRHVPSEQPTATLSAEKPVDEIQALVGIAASNTFPVTDDSAEAIVLVVRGPVVPVPTLSGVGPSLLLLLLTLLGVREIRSRKKHPARMALT